MATDLTKEVEIYDRGQQYDLSKSQARRSSRIGLGVGAATGLAKLTGGVLSTAIKATSGAISAGAKVFDSVSAANDARRKAFANDAARYAVTGYTVAEYNQRVRSLYEQRAGAVEAGDNNTVMGCTQEIMRLENSLVEGKDRAKAAFKDAYLETLGLTGKECSGVLSQDALAKKLGGWFAGTNLGVKYAAWKRDRAEVSAARKAEKERKAEERRAGIGARVNAELDARRARRERRAGASDLETIPAESGDAAGPDVTYASPAPFPSVPYEAADSSSPKPVSARPEAEDSSDEPLSREEAVAPRRSIWQRIKSKAINFYRDTSDGIDGYFEKRAKKRDEKDIARAEEILNQVAQTHGDTIVVNPTSLGKCYSPKPKEAEPLRDDFDIEDPENS